MKKALIFDCDGVLADTERYGHLPAFNQMWREFGVPWQWSEQQYGQKLLIGGGKERMASLFDDEDFLAVFTPPQTEEARRELIAGWHARKSEIYKEIIYSGKIPSRSGIKRICQEALEKGWLLAVASTSKKESVEFVLRHTVGDELFGCFSAVLGGDVVKAKKPAPDIYELTAKELDIAPSNCVVVEDSRNGLLAAIRAGMHCVVTVSSYTRREDFSEAAIVLSCLGDPDGEECEILANRSAAKPDSFLTIDDMEMIIA